MRNVNFHHEPRCITGKCSPRMKVDRELLTAGEAHVRGGRRVNYGGESKITVTDSYTCTVEEVTTALQVRKANSLVLTLFAPMLPKITVKSIILLHDLDDL